MVFIVEDEESGTQHILKFYSMGEKNALIEIDLHSKLMDNNQLIKMSDFTMESTPKKAFTYEGVRYCSYSYLIFPFCKNGDIFDFMFNVGK